MGRSLNLQTAVAALADPTGALTAQAATCPGCYRRHHHGNAEHCGSVQREYFDFANRPATGDIQLQIGGAGGTTQDIAITAGCNDTLNTLSNYINTQGTAGNWGVTSTVVPDGGGYHLEMSHPTPAPAGALGFTNNTTILSVAPNPATNLSFGAPVGDTNAALTIDGMPFSRSSNTVTGAIQGVLLSPSTCILAQPVQLTIRPDTSQIADTVNNFVSAYNTAVSTIKSQYVADPTGTIPAPTFESGLRLRSLQSSLLTDASYAVSVAGLPNQAGDTSETAIVHEAWLEVERATTAATTFRPSPQEPAAAVISFPHRAADWNA